MMNRVTRPALRAEGGSTAGAPPLLGTMASTAASGAKTPDARSALYWVGFVAWGSIPAVVFMLLYSSMGYGVEFYHLIVTNLAMAEMAAAGAVFVALLAWFIRADRAPTPIKVVLLLVFTVCALVTTGLMQRDMPSAPLGVFTVLLPVWAYSLDLVVTEWRKSPDGADERNNTAVEDFQIAWKTSLAIAALLFLAGCIYNGPDVVADTEIEQTSSMWELLECDEGHATCLRPYLMWSFAFLAALVHLVYAFFIVALVDVGKEMDESKKEKAAFMFVAMIGLISALVWVAAEVAAANVHLSKVVTMFAFAGFAGIFLVAVFYTKKLERQHKDLSEGKQADSTVKEKGDGRGLSTLEEKQLEKYKNLKTTLKKQLESERGAWIWGFICFAPMPYLFAAYVAADWVRTKVHRSGLSCFAPPDEVELNAGESKVREATEARESYPWASPWLAERLVTLFGVREEARQPLDKGQQQPTEPQPHDGKNWSSILSKAIVISLAFLTVNVGIGKATMLVLSALIVALRGVNLGIVVIVFVVVGVLMFMLPPVPGIPVYLTGGLLITSSARHAFGYGPALGLAIFASFSLKLLAVFIQQEGIGRFLAGHVAVRKAVGVNSEQTRAIKRILQQPGLTIPKVSILVGGPDWPTSVLAGILRINVLQSLLGTLPVIVVIAPQCTVGALEGDDPPLSQQWSNILLLFASVMAMLPLGLAMYFINQETGKKRAGASDGQEGLEDEKLDEEVLELEEKEAMATIVYGIATHWRRELFTRVDVTTTDIDGTKHKAVYFLEKDEKEKMLKPIDSPPKLVLFLGWLCASLSVLLVGMFDDHCFQEFDITDTIEEKLGGNPANVVHPMGWFALFLNVLSFGAWWYFGRWGKTQAAPLEKSLRDREPDTIMELANKAEPPSEAGYHEAGGNKQKSKRWRGFRVSRPKKNKAAPMS